MSSDLRSVYVCASSDELERARWAMSQVRAEGWVVAGDWVAEVLAVGEANPRDAPAAQRRAWAAEALARVRRSSAVWVLAPEVGHGRGAFAELAAAHLGHRPLVVSGPACTESIFAALGQEVATDAEALPILRRWLS